MSVEYFGTRVSVNDNQMKKIKATLAVRDEEIRVLKEQVCDLLKIHAEREAVLLARIEDGKKSIRFYQSRAKAHKKQRTSEKTEVTEKQEDVENEELDKDRTDISGDIPRISNYG